MSDEFQVIIVDDTQNLVVEIENQVQPDIEVSISPDPTALIVEVDNGIVGPQGPTGPTGPGVPVGGTYGQMLTKNSSTNYDTSWVDGVLVTTVRNNTGATITAGTVVYLNGMLGNRPTIAKSLANADATSAQTYGMVAIDIPDNSDGPVVHSGQCKNLNTFGVPEGVTLYLSPTVPGGYTATKPVAPNHMVYVGICTRAHPTQGTIEVTIQNGYELEELHNVLISSPTNNQALVYESSTQLWKNHTLTPADIGAQPSLGFTPEDVANKSTNTALGTSDTLYPTQNAVKTYVDGAVVAGSTPDATSTVKGKVKLAGDLGGTADLPTVPGLAGKQATLVSGTNIKTVNGNSLLGSGGITITPGGNAFGNITTPTGTFPSALNTSDTLNLQTSDKFVSIEGNQTTNVVDVKAGPFAIALAIIFG